MQSKFLADASQLLEAVKPMLISIIKEAENAAPMKAFDQADIRLGAESGVHWNSLIKSLEPEALQKRLVEGSAREINEESLNTLCLPEEVAEGEGKSSLIAFVQKTLQYSVNTWHQGFMDKLYASTNAVCGIDNHLVI